MSLKILVILLFSGIVVAISNQESLSNQKLPSTLKILENVQNPPNQLHQRSKRFVPNDLNINFTVDNMLSQLTNVMGYFGIDTSGMLQLQNLYNSAFSNDHLLFKRRILNLIMRTSNFLLTYLPEEAPQENPQLLTLNTYFTKDYPERKPENLQDTVINTTEVENAETNDDTDEDDTEINEIEFLGNGRPEISTQRPITNSVYTTTDNKGDSNIIYLNLATNEEISPSKNNSVVSTNKEEMTEDDVTRKKRNLYFRFNFQGQKPITTTTTRRPLTKSVNVRFNWHLGRRKRENNQDSKLRTLNNAKNRMHMKEIQDDMKKMIEEAVQEAENMKSLLVSKEKAANLTKMQKMQDNEKRLQDIRDKIRKNANRFRPSTTENVKNLKKLESRTKRFAQTPFYLTKRIAIPSRTTTTERPQVIEKELHIGGNSNSDQDFKIQNQSQSQKQNQSLLANIKIDINHNHNYYGDRKKHRDSVHEEKNSHEEEEEISEDYQDEDESRRKKRAAVIEDVTEVIKELEEKVPNVQDEKKEKIEEAENEEERESTTVQVSLLENLPVNEKIAILEDEIEENRRIIEENNDILYENERTTEVIDTQTEEITEKNSEEEITEKAEVEEEITEKGEEEEITEITKEDIISTTTDNISEEQRITEDAEEKSKKLEERVNDLEARIKQHTNDEETKEEMVTEAINETPEENTKVQEELPVPIPTEENIFKNAYNKEDILINEDLNEEMLAKDADKLIQKLNKLNQLVTVMSEILNNQNTLKENEENDLKNKKEEEVNSEETSTESYVQEEEITTITSELYTNTEYTKENEESESKSNAEEDSSREASTESYAPEEEITTIASNISMNDGNSEEKKENEEDVIMVSTTPYTEEIQLENEEIFTSNSLIDTTIGIIEETTIEDNSNNNNEETEDSTTITTTESMITTTSANTNNELQIKEEENDEEDKEAVEIEEETVEKDQKPVEIEEIEVKYEEVTEETTQITETVSSDPTTQSLNLTSNPSEDTIKQTTANLFFSTQLETTTSQNMPEDNDKVISLLTTTETPLNVIYPEGYTPERSVNLKKIPSAEDLVQHHSHVVLKLDGNVQFEDVAALMDNIENRLEHHDKKMIVVIRRTKPEDETDKHKEDKTKNEDVNDEGENEKEEEMERLIRQVEDVTEKMDEEGDLRESKNEKKLFVSPVPKNLSSSSNPSVGMRANHKVTAFGDKGMKIEDMMSKNRTNKIHVNVKKGSNRTMIVNDLKAGTEELPMQINLNITKKMMKIEGNKTQEPIKTLEDYMKKDEEMKIMKKIESLDKQEETTIPMPVPILMNMKKQDLQMHQNHKKINKKHDYHEDQDEDEDDDDDDYEFDFDHGIIEYFDDVFDSDEESEEIRRKPSQKKHKHKEGQQQHHEENKRPKRYLYGRFRDSLGNFYRITEGKHFQGPFFNQENYAQSSIRTVANTPDTSNSYPYPGPWIEFNPSILQNNPKPTENFIYTIYPSSNTKNEENFVKFNVKDNAKTQDHKDNNGNSNFNSLPMFNQAQDFQKVSITVTERFPQKLTDSELSKTTVLPVTEFSSFSTTSTTTTTIKPEENIDLRTGSENDFNTFPFSNQNTKFDNKFKDEKLVNDLKAVLFENSGHEEVNAKNNDKQPSKMNLFSFLPLFEKKNNFKDEDKDETAEVIVNLANQENFYLKAPVDFSQEQDKDKKHSENNLLQTTENIQTFTEDRFNLKDNSNIDIIYSYENKEQGLKVFSGYVIPTDNIKNIQHIENQNNNFSDKDIANLPESTTMQDNQDKVVPKQNLQDEDVRILITSEINTEDPKQNSSNSLIGNQSLQVEGQSEQEDINNDTFTQQEGLQNSQTTQMQNSEDTTIAVTPTLDMLNSNKEINTTIELSLQQGQFDKLKPPQDFSNKFQSNIATQKFTTIELSTTNTTPAPPTMIEIIPQEEGLYLSSIFDPSKPLTTVKIGKDSTPMLYESSRLMVTTPKANLVSSLKPEISIIDNNNSERQDKLLTDTPPKMKENEDKNVENSLDKSIMEIVSRFGHNDDESVDRSFVPPLIHISQETSTLGHRLQSSPISIPSQLSEDDDRIVFLASRFNSKEEVPTANKTEDRNQISSVEPSTEIPTTTSIKTTIVTSKSMEIQKSKQNIVVNYIYKQTSKDNRPKDIFQETLVVNHPLGDSNLTVEDSTRAENNKKFMKALSGARRGDIVESVEESEENVEDGLINVKVKELQEEIQKQKQKIAQQKQEIIKKESKARTSEGSGDDVKNGNVLNGSIQELQAHGIQEGDSDQADIEAALDSNNFGQKVKEKNIN